MRTVFLSALLCVGVGCARVSSNQPVRYVVDGARAPTFRVAQGKGTALLLLNEETGARAASMSVLELLAGGTVPEHVHADSVEMLYVEEGGVEMTVEGQTMSVRQGDAVYIPAGLRHSARVSADTPRFRSVQVYVGPGPEARFRQGEPVTPAVSP